MTDVRPDEIRERIRHARAASARCRGQIERIHDRTDPGDAALRGFLSDLIAEEARSGSRLEALDKEATPVPPETPDLPGDAAVDRDTALFLAEQTEQERTHAFENLADDLLDGEVREVIRLEAARGRPRLILLRNIWLANREAPRRLESLSRPSRTWLIDELAGLIVQVRDGRDPQHDLRSLFDRGVAGGETGRKTIPLLLDSLQRSESADASTVSGGLDHLARAESPAEILRVARRVLTSLMEHGS